LNTSALTSAIEFLSECSVSAVRLHAARTLGAPRRFGTIKTLRQDAERDMFSRDVRELFLASYAEALRADRLRGSAAAVLGSVLSSNVSVALDALLARGCFEPNESLCFIFDDMLSRAPPNGYFFEPHQSSEARSFAGRQAEEEFILTTACYARYLTAFGRGRDARVRNAFDWLATKQDEDGTWRPRRRPPHDALESYLLTRAVALAFSELPATSIKRFATMRRRLAAGWVQRVLPDAEDFDAVVTELNVAPDPVTASRERRIEVGSVLRDRILYFPLEDLWLALAIGASSRLPNLVPWIEWLEGSQLADGSWRLQNPGLRERLLLSDPNGRLRAEALYLTDEWITLRAAQILRLAGTRARASASEALVG
jgi:hypothetical protein